MTKLFLLFVFSTLFGCSNIAFAQSTEDLIGDWKVSDVQILSSSEKEVKQKFAKIKSIFLKSTFHFKSDNLFSFDTPSDEFTIKAARWKFETTKSYIEIFNRSKSGVTAQLMGIFVKVVQGQYYFLMEETPIVLTIIKM